MSRGAWALVVVLICTGCGDTSAADDTGHTGNGGSAGDSGSGGDGGGSVSGGAWGNGGSAQGGSAAGGAASGGSSAGGGGNTKPYYLHAGRTYDQEKDYIEWDGQVSFVMLKHKDQTSLPADEGGASCSGGCDEQVTRIEAGASVWGKFKGITGINVQLASTDEAGVGSGVVSICNQDLPAFNLKASSTGLPGFNNMPSPAHAVSPTDDCQWRVKAVGGFVYFRAVTVTTPAGSGGGGGTGGSGTGGGGTGGIPQ